MRIAIISDIHGNCIALDAVLADLERSPLGIDKIVCLGDAIQGGAQPAETVTSLRELSCPVVMGNADAWLLTGQDTGTVEKATEKQLQVREWSLSQLSKEDLSFIEGFEPTIEMPLEGGVKLLCFHGSPTSFDDLIFPETPEEEFQKMLGGFTPAIMTGGHTHLQHVRRIGDLFYFNPGSVGVAYDRHQSEEDFRCDPWAEYAVLACEDGRIALEFRRVPFEVDKLISLTIASGRPYAEEIVSRYGG
jgi:putative phosphoesterase